MSNYEIISISIAILSVIVAILSLIKSKRNKISIDSIMSNNQVIENYLNSGNFRGDSYVANGWIGGNNKNCKAINNTIKHCSLDEFKNQRASE